VSAARERGATRDTALVTGGSAGIGAAICEALLAAGYEVISLDRRPPAKARPGLTTVEVDLTDRAATRSVAQQIAARAPAATIVHNAGAVREKPLEEVTPEDLGALAQLHLGAALALVQANLAAMRARRYGRVVLVSSRAVLGLARRTAYSSTKAGMLGLARTWALELGPDGITVNVVAPGPIEGTELFHDLVPVGSEKYLRAAQSVPVRRLGRPDDVARAVMFFLAPEAGFVTGQTLFVCGGTSIGSIVY
jgi:NAD(P)-dependent dehydrogenase (short-subunit alcohol dehydrogenase family)